MAMTKTKKPAKKTQPKERALGNTDDAKRNTTLVERLQGGIA